MSKRNTSETPALPSLLDAASEFDARALRKRRGFRQVDFWAKVGCTQSGGSRYEAGRNISQPVMMLLTLAYGTDRQAQKLLDWLRSKP